MIVNFAVQIEEALQAAQDQEEVHPGHQDTHAVIEGQDIVVGGRPGTGYEHGRRDGLQDNPAG